MTVLLHGIGRVIGFVNGECLIAASLAVERRQYTHA